MPQRAQLQSAWIDDQRATAAYNSKTNPTDAQVQQALAAVQNAKSNLAKLTPMTEDLAAAQARGHRVVPGLGMLLNQAPPAWKAWFGIEPQVTPDLRRMIEATL